MALTLEDRIAIEDLFTDYAWALDTGDVDAACALFTSDAVVADPGGRYDGSDGVRAFFERFHSGSPQFPGRQHWIGQTLLEGDGRRCTARSFAVVTQLHGTGATNVHLVAHYRDALVKVDGAWRFRERIIDSWRGDVLARFPEYEAITGRDDDD
jgi:uncharacterized protein (TIGR02246 family)